MANKIKLIFLILFFLLLANVSYSQDFDIINLDNNSEGQQQLTLEELQSLIQEFKDIMAIPKEQRTIEQWERAIEILFLVYFGADLQNTFVELQSEIDKYKALIEQLEINTDLLESAYEQELKILENLKFLYANFDKLIESNKFNIYFGVGYTINFGLNADFGFAYNITDNIGLGISLGIETNFIQSYIDLQLFILIMF